MTTLILIRHGQASFDGPSYDRLCARGKAQSRLIGAALAGAGRRPVAAVSGRLERQRATAALALGGAENAPEVAVDAAFDEYPSDALFADHWPTVQAADPDLTAAGPAYRQDRRLFQRALAGVLARWQSGAAGTAESWESFLHRVRDGMERAVAGRGKDDVVAVFTSGGVIGTAVGSILGLPPDRAIALSWRIHNASLTEIAYGRSGFSLIAFNETGHLRRHGSGALLTFR